VNLWLKNKAHPMLFTKEQLHNNVEEALTLAPAQEPAQTAADGPSE
jgi:hypothetical protein